MSVKKTANESIYRRRLENVRKKSKSPLLIRSLKNIRYLTGFTGTSAVVLICQEQAWFITDRRYAEQAKDEIDPQYTLYFQKAKLLPELAALCKQNNIIEVVLEEEAFTIGDYNRLCKAVDSVVFTAVPSPVTQIRQKKDKREIESIKTALRLTEEAMIYIAAMVKPGIREDHIAAELEHYCRLKGAQGMSFETIVASGPRSAMPHGVASSKKIEADELVLFDFGVQLDGYCSDFTRVVYTGKRLPRRLQRLWEKVLEAHAIGLSSIKVGVPACQPDKLVRDYFSKKRALKYYEHSLGHGVGVEIHEAPRLSWQSNEVLQEGMVVTVEPGLYYPGLGGIRLEDMVVVRKNGAHLLTDFPLEVACLGG